ncbi:MAG: hypothetical protein VB933_01115 [Pseudomonadales bacterium]
MLTQLSIRNFVLVENLEIALDSGVTVLTGESGAGNQSVGLVDPLQPK